MRIRTNVRQLQGGLLLAHTRLRTKSTKPAGAPAKTSPSNSNLAECRFILTEPTSLLLLHTKSSCSRLTSLLAGILPSASKLHIGLTEWSSHSKIVKWSEKDRHY